MNILVYLIISLLLTSVVYISSNNIILSGVTLLFSLIYFIFFNLPIYKKYTKRLKRFHQCYFFINSYIIALNIKGSTQAAMTITLDAMDPDFDEIKQSMQAMNSDEKLQHLNKYFKFHVYTLFKEIVRLWQEEGGDIIAMSSYLSNQTRIIEEYLNRTSSIKKSRILEFVILWVFSLMILVLLRFSLAQFYDSISKLAFYPIAILGLIVFTLFSIHIATLRATEINIQGWDEDEIKF